MALEHAILVSLSEHPAAGLDLTRRFDRSIGFFWNATHQQIYRTLARMEADGWVSSAQVSQAGRRDKKEYVVTAAGRAELQRWLAEPAPPEAFRSDLAVRLRAASYGDRDAVLDQVEAHLAEHAVRLAHYQHLARRDFADPGPLDDQQRDVHLVLRGGIRLEQFWVEWLSEVLDAYGRTRHHDRPAPDRAPHDRPARRRIPGPRSDRSTT
ncbi:PadR family transcriptional regulator [Nocardioides mesophilus]|uniref:PadR family transcriptional regulator n=1 Tax=Nocardioides mesophilus TaxID=433659 RepID=A0A7G9RFI7_9ACTN|nr:PadR family transcriptional regulator [Nocardioides mesophilus]QNN54362.1 PadR family transcriptional regulator [Nocardioides mesophilus]